MRHIFRLPLNRAASRRMRLAARAGLRTSRQMGYWRSIRERASIDGDGNPLPWYVYPAISHLGALDFSSARIFEYGCGNSTKFWVQRAAQVTSVESDPAWHAKVVRDVGSDATVLLREDEDSYVGAIHESDVEFDVVIVDGLHRGRCTTEAIARLAVGGMIIFDNSDWYPDLAEQLRDADLLQIDFAGWGPINRHTWVTSLFLHREARFEPLQVQPRSPIGARVWEAQGADEMDAMFASAHAQRLAR